ncbi:hypothetical protein [Streptosporangium sp. NPDC002607]
MPAVVNIPAGACTLCATLMRQGIALATEHHPDPAAEAGRLLGLTVAGVSPHQVR